jgi:hypothetical protein
LVYNDAEQGFSFTHRQEACQLRRSINRNFPHSVPRVDTIIPTRRTGWVKLWSQTDTGLVGAAINRYPNSQTATDAFNGGHNLHALTTTAASTVTIPVFPATCR